MAAIIGESVITCSAPIGGITNRKFIIIEQDINGLEFIRCSVQGINTNEGRSILSAGIRYTTSMTEIKKNSVWHLSNYRKLQIVKYVKNMLFRFIIVLLEKC